MKGVHHNRLIRDCIRVPSFRGIHTGIRVVDLNRAVTRNASRNEEVTAIGEITRTYVNDHDEAVFEIANEACCRGREFLARKAKLSGIINKKFADSPFPIDRIPIGGRKSGHVGGRLVGFAREP